MVVLISKDTDATPARLASLPVDDSEAGVRRG